MTKDGLKLHEMMLKMGSFGGAVTTLVLPPGRVAANRALVEAAQAWGLAVRTDSMCPEDSWYLVQEEGVAALEAEIERMKVTR